MSRRKYVESYGGGYIIGMRRDPETGERGQLVQTDWDFPSAARDLGWNMRRVQVRQNGERVRLRRAPKRGAGCDHLGTDGTVTCGGCGATAADFIGAAAEYLDSLS